MEQFKLEIAKEAQLYKPLKFESLDSDIAALVVKEVKEVGGFVTSAHQSLFQFLDVTLQHTLFYDKDLSADVLSSIILKDNVNVDLNCYVIWDDIGHIDKFTVTDLIEYWEYVWYATSDEAVILYLYQSKIIILITDYGVVKTNLDIAGTKISV